MNSRILCFSFAALCLFTTGARGQNGVLDLTSLKNYANQPVPAYITRNNTPGNNPITNGGATLGRVLFYDKRLSNNNTIACASCHKQSLGFGDSPIASTGVAGTTGRHGMRLINARFATEVRAFWDERATSIEDQTTRPIRDHVEMGFSGTSGDPVFSDVLTKVSAIQEYRVMFSAVFGDSAITEDRIQRALAQFVRSIQSFDSRYDIGRAQVAGDGAPFPNFTADENAGKALFLNPPGPGGGAGCNGCHRAPEFDIDPASRNNGITASIGGGTDLTNTRSPSLRDVVGIGGASNGPLMHDGSKATLLDVINHYNAIPGDNANLDPRLRRPGGVQNLGLNNTQKNQLVAFLRTLTGNAVYTDERWSNPFDANGQLTLIVIPSSVTSFTRNANGTATISASGATGLSYILQASTDLLDWQNVTTLSPNAQGVLQYTVTISGSVFYRFAYIPPAS